VCGITPFRRTLEARSVEIIMIGFFKKPDRRLNGRLW